MEDTKTIIVLPGFLRGARQPPGKDEELVDTGNINLAKVTPTSRKSI